MIKGQCSACRKCVIMPADADTESYYGVICRPCYDEKRARLRMYWNPLGTYKYLVEPYDGHFFDNTAEDIERIKEHIHTAARWDIVVNGYKNPPKTFEDLLRCFRAHFDRYKPTTIHLEAERIALVTYMEEALVAFKELVQLRAEEPQRALAAAQKKNNTFTKVWSPKKKNSR